MLGKPQEEQSKSVANRITLPEESEIRDVSGFKELVAMAEASKGREVELAWTTKIPEQRFVLDILWDPSQKAPFWTLYEQMSGESKRLWNEPVPISNLDLCYDVLVMACGGSPSSSKNLAEILSVKNTAEDSSKGSKDKSTVTTTSSNTAIESKKNTDNLKTESIAEEKNPANAPGVDAQIRPDALGASATTNAPTQNMATPVSNLPNTGQIPLPPNLPPNAFVLNSGGFVSIPQANNLPGASTYMTPSYPVPNPWPYVAPAGMNMNMYGQAPVAPAQQTTMPGAGLDATQNLNTGERTNLLPIDNTLLNKKNDISLVDLIMKAELITQNSLDAALKMQELIQSGGLDSESAAEILKHHHEKGEHIEDYVDMPRLAFMDKLSGQTKKRNLNRKENPEVYDLLTQAGLISLDDIKTAEAVVKKHGGDLGSVLTAAHKLDDNTLDAAKTCILLQKDGSLKTEQSVILLNYCSRSRVSFDEALSELNWPDPRCQSENTEQSVFK